MRIQSVVLCASLLGALATPANAQTRDRQFIDSGNEYFVADGPFDSDMGMGIVLARMLRAPTGAGSQARFMAISSNDYHQAGAEFSSQWFWRTRAAAQGDLAPMKVVFVPQNLKNENTSLCRAPASRDEVVEADWSMVRMQYQEGRLWSATAGFMDLSCVRVEQ